MSVKDNSIVDTWLAQLWAGLLCAFCFCLRISELLALQPGDVEFTRGNGSWAMSIWIRKSKTDHAKVGATRILRAAVLELCPVMAMGNLPSASNLSRESDEPSFPTNFRRKLAFLMKWDEGGNGITASVVNTHSLSVRVAQLRCSLPG